MKKQIKRLTALMLCISLCAIFTSCDFLSSFSSKPLTAPPVLLEKQDEIIKALKSSVGEQIDLVHPATGENRSAFMLCDLDGDGNDEAIAFYRPLIETAAIDVAHINILKNDKEGWSSICDIVGESAGIDRVSICTFSGKKRLVIGWALTRDKEKTLVCYSLSGKTPARDFTAGYVEFAVSDFWAQNEGDELITVNYSQGEEKLLPPTWEARLILELDGAFSVKSKVALDPRVTGYKKCIAGKYNESNYAYFLDGVLDAANVNTQILTVNQNGELKNPLLVDGQTAESNIHKATQLTVDINGDGILEVPHQTAVLGYESLPESEQIYKTVWHHLIDGALKKSEIMFISSLGVRVTIPRELDGKITLRSFAAEGKISFYEYGGSLDKSEDELFSIKIYEKENFEIEDGFEVLKSTDYTVVTVNMSNSEHPLCPTWQTVFKMVEIV